MNSYYIEIVNRILADRRDEVWVEEDLPILRSEVKVVRCAVARGSTLYCPLEWCILRCHPQDYLLKNLKSFESIAFPDDRQFQHFSLVYKQ